MVRPDKFVQSVVFILRKKSGRPVAGVMPKTFNSFSHGHFTAGAGERVLGFERECLLFYRWALAHVL